MKDERMYKIGTVITAYTDMMHAYDKREFIEFFITAATDINGSAYLPFGKGTVGLHDIAGHIYDVFSRLHGNEAKLWMYMDEDNREIVSQMVETYLKNHAYERARY